MAEQVPDILRDLAKRPFITHDQNQVRSPFSEPHRHHDMNFDSSHLDHEISHNPIRYQNDNMVSQQLPLDFLSDSTCVHTSNIQASNFKSKPVSLYIPSKKPELLVPKKMAPLNLRQKPRHGKLMQIPSEPSVMLANASPISTKYEKMIKEYTGRLKFRDDECTFSSFSVEDIILLGEIGVGVSGTVYIVEHKISKLKMAAKMMKWNPQLEEQKRILMDLKTMSIQKSEYIVFYYGSLIVKDTVWLYMELMDTCLDKVLKKYGALPEEIVGKIVVATLNALHYLKSVHDIIHRDVKPSNILINSSGEIKICDFGISKQLVESCAETRGAGPTAYISPERLDIDLKEYDVRADVWSLGITVIELLTGKLPYSNCKSDMEVMSQIFQDPPPRLPDIFAVSNECRHFLNLCLTKDYKQRPKFQELLEFSDFIKIYQTKYVAVATWFLSLSEKK
eukprot:TRINITY_DN15390_c0_g1_i1.p1 TRINITY_DN15390_c0_g1~~TRINITY_DN15390_c0_g1_i1.p1  ORF type:complete len:450 (+),score=26.91 TRINITY_DN15390_c0_g1_i1:118-1467(+)